MALSLLCLSLSIGKLQLLSKGRTSWIIRRDFNSILGQHEEKDDHTGRGEKSLINLKKNSLVDIEIQNLALSHGTTKDMGGNSFMILEILVRFLVSEG